MSESFIECVSDMTFISRVRKSENFPDGKIFVAKTQKFTANMRKKFFFANFKQVRKWRGQNPPKSI